MIERQQSYWPSGRHCGFRLPTNATIELKDSLETSTLEKIVEKSCGYWISPDVEAGKFKRYTHDRFYDSDDTG